MTADRTTEPVFTGVGVVAPTGDSLKEHWTSVLTGASGIRPIEQFDAAGFPVRWAGQVADFDALVRVPKRLVRQTDRWTHLALYAAESALADAGLDPTTVPEYEVGVVTASSSGGTEFGQHEMEELYQRGPKWVGAYQSIAWFYAATTGQISIRHGFRGPCGVLANEQAGGLDALAQSRRLLRGGSRTVISGGTDSALCPYGLTAQWATGHLAAPAAAYLPFGTGAAGYLTGEGGAIYVLERPDVAAARGAAPYGRLLGCAAGFDQSHRPDREPVLAAVIGRALADADRRPEDVDVVFADGAGTPAADRTEAAAITAVFGPRAVPVTVPKTLTGRLYGGGAPLDVATALMALTEQVIPPTWGPIELSADCAGIDLVQHEPREQRLRTALVLARGHGGFTAATVIGAAR